MTLPSTLIAVSVNPAVDRRIWLDRLELGQVNRAKRSVATAGGKAANVALAARALGQPVIWVGLLGGAAGAECEKQLIDASVELCIVRTRAETRVNLELIEPDAAVTEVLEPGGEVTADELDQLDRICKDLFAKHRERAVVVLSGSLPPGAPSDLYSVLTQRAHGSGCRVVLDTAGEPLLAGLMAGPELVKPNAQEATAALGFPVRDTESAARAAQALVAQGAGAAAVSRGPDGIVWVGRNAEHGWWARAGAVNSGSAVGSGDAAVAALAVGLLHAIPIERALIHAAACGAANCASNAKGKISLAEVQAFADDAVLESIRLP
ncbi:MAG TPA: hexose kinase [Polyangiaceae bacterium]